MTTNKKNQKGHSESLPQRMERLIGSVKKRKVKEAADLVFDSWETADSDESYALLTEAVELDPRNVDAWRGLMNFEPLGCEEEIAFLRQLVALGEKNLGKKVFQELKGHFWGFLETRPYMRARARLAQRLVQAGRLEEAVTEHEGMLELCPNDNLGIRYGLMALYLALNNLEGANRLFREYDEREFSATFAWAFVLERYLAGDSDGAAEALAAARKQNPYAEAYFSKAKNLPKRMPGAYSTGSQEEAMIAWDILQTAWKKHKEAQVWVIGQCARKKA
ncbi:MAG: tetratricopeptide repeat protein [Kiritimatiellae bacterium]|jgi:tetratricopeptide (TPR) repeat protein|nr:tetratricopeptide repeat protein [Kiritimatiellia bacterium]MDD2346764.1 tetratricopeptide repeat protein [Kiritimatiellia bacterium]MDD3583034.1 tetratricopeptide repeat protein [Kiritimatiellia bacterium]HHU16004.1 tetratricopeptide repeat protein [Lentisphaerota bacterium]HON46907.1 tetratricopeptide repeat protein [Kiritimatiellia bacterium]